MIQYTHQARLEEIILLKKLIISKEFKITKT